MGVTETTDEDCGADLFVGLRWVDMQNYRDPPPYPGHSKQVFTNQPGFRQSFSGSETSTDVSLSSNENLATLQRQEPQGEETQASFNYHLDLSNTEGSGYSILQRLGMPASAIGSHIFNNTSSQFHPDANQQKKDFVAPVSSNLEHTLTSLQYSKERLTPTQWHLANKSHLQPGDTSALSDYTLLSTSQGQPLLTHPSCVPSSTVIVKSELQSYSCPPATHVVCSSDPTGVGPGLTSSFSSSSLSSNSHQYLSPRVLPVSTYHHPHPYVNTHWTLGSGDSGSSSHSSSHVGYHSNEEVDHMPLAAKTSQMLEVVTQENRTLREELALTSVRVAKMQKFEMEIQKVHESYEALVKSSQKQEGLWLVMKRKLEARIQALEMQKATAGSSQVSASLSDSELRLKLAEKDAMIASLMSQNQELMSSRYQLEGENAQVSLSLAEQKSRVDFLETALLKAQAKIMSLEEEHHKMPFVDKVEQLQNALKTLQSSSDKREKSERDLRAHIEKELETCRAQEKMEQKYVTDITMRHLDQKTTALPKELRLTALEKSSEMEKLIDEAKVEKLKHMEELHYSQKTVTELEAKVKQLQTQLSEKDTMVKLYQRSPLATARSSSLHALCHSPLHSSSISSHGWSGSSQGTESTSIRHTKAGSSSAVEMGSKKLAHDELVSRVNSLTTENKKEPEEELQLFHV